MQVRFLTRWGLSRFIRRRKLAVPIRYEKFV